MRGTALASTLIAGAMLIPTEAQAQAMCPQGAPPGPIVFGSAMSITCVNTADRTDPTNVGAILLASGGSIDLTNSGQLFGLTAGIQTIATGSIVIDNSGSIAVSAMVNGYGISASSIGAISIANSGDFTVNASRDGYGIYASSIGGISIANSGDIAVTAGRDGYGISASSIGAISIANSGDFVVNAGRDGYGILASSNGGISIANSGGIAVTAGDDGYGILASSAGAVGITNSGGIAVTAVDNGYGIAAGSSSAVSIANSGDFVVNAVRRGYGILAGSSNAVSIANSGDFVVNSGQEGYGISAGSGGAMSIANSGDFVVTAGGDGYGIRASAGSGGVSIDNSGGLDVAAAGTAAGINAFAIFSSVGVSIANSGGINARGAAGAVGIGARSLIGDGDISIVNSGDIETFGGMPGSFANPLVTDVAIAAASYNGGAISIVNSGAVAATGAFGVGIGALSLAPGAPIGVVNSGAVNGSAIGVGLFGNGQMAIANLAGGSISGGFAGAINAKGLGAISITNAGLVTGFVDLTGQNDLFVNQPGGVFQAGGTSVFGGGSDLFINQVGGLVDTADSPGADEATVFVGLETFQNFGTVSLLDGGEGDLFTIANTPGGTDLNYVAGSFLAVDAFLGGPGSRSDIFRIDGNVAGVTDVIVNNTNPLPGTFNPVGITVVQVRGSVANNAFVLANGPIDTGFFNFDLFTENDGTFTNFELRSFPGAGAQLLPQLVTAAQDIWHQTSDTWFDRSADLRTQLWRNGGSVAGMPGVMSLGGGAKDGVVAEPGLSPAVWARVSHGELEQDGSARTNAFGRSYNFNLDRELYIIDVQSGVDFALQGVMNPSDVLLLSVFGGGVSANLQYDQLDRRRFDYDGGQVGVAATYLSGGLFVDALFNAQFLEVDPNALGFAGSFDSNSYGFRIDSGYRFGMGSGGLFLEPLLTLAYVDSDIDGFSFAGNTVSFQDEDSLRGRVGLRAGTSLFIENVRFEPFVIASYWGELSDDDNRATLVSSGTRFGFRDAREDSWGEVSLGTNTFLAGNNALSAFSKIDIIFGDDTEGYIAQSGFRVQW